MSVRDARMRLSIELLLLQVTPERGANRDPVPPLRLAPLTPQAPGAGTK